MSQPEDPHRVLPFSQVVTLFDFTRKAGFVQCTEWMNVADNDAVQRDSGILLEMDSDDSDLGQHGASWSESSPPASLDLSFSHYISQCRQDVDSQPAAQSSWIAFCASSPLDEDIITIDSDSPSSSGSSLFDSENQDSGSRIPRPEKLKHGLKSPTKQPWSESSPKLRMQTRTTFWEEEIRLRSRPVSRVVVKAQPPEMTARPIERMPAFRAHPQSPPRSIGLRNRKATVCRKSIERTQAISKEIINVDDDWESSADESQDTRYQGSSTSFNLEKTGKSQFVTIEDISGGLELFSIRVWNDINAVKAPPPFIYITGLEDEAGYIRTPCICQCRGVCNDVRCHCMGEPYSPNITEPAYNEKTGLLNRPLNWLTSTTPHIPRVIWECSQDCPCGSNCPNRSAQLGLRYPFEVFMTREKGWGVRALRDLPAGAFVAEYSGEVKEDFDDNKTPLPENWYTFWLIPEPGEFNGQRFYIDASKKGNITRFINHGCSPNVCAINVFYDDNDPTRGMHIGFYTIRKVKAYQELTLDYAADFWNGKLAKQEYCKCRSSRCYWKEPTNKTKRAKGRSKR